MEYTALYRKYRPIRFDDMVGQEHITKTIKNQIMAGRIGHAYLFNGGRGTGKTTTAKILARAVNCLNPQNGEPCNECEICKAALAGSLTDIVEMDAASNNSVDDIRAIRDEVNFLPTLAKYRVYIIDEVHMLSTGAFNALLKTLEEPPAHVKFILATTEPQKLPATILSRCQRFDFKKISNEDISKRLKFVCDQSKIEITDNALSIISVLSEGAMRDALSILERCLQEGNEKIDEDLVKDLVGIPKLMYISGIIEAIMNQNTNLAIETIQKVIEEGKDLQNLLWELIKYVKDLLVYKTTGKLELYNNEEMEKIKTLSSNMEKELLLNIIYELSELENNMKWSSQKIVIFQVGILKLCNHQFGNSNSKSYTNEKGSESSRQDIIELKNRIMQLEAQVHQLKNQPISYNSSENGNEKEKKETKHIKKVEVKVGDVVNKWQEIVSTFKTEGKILIYTNLMNSKAFEIDDLTIGITFENGLTPFGKTILEKYENKTEIEKKLSIELGKTIGVRYIDGKKEVVVPKDTKNNIENFAEGNDIPFNIVD